MRLCDTRYSDEGDLIDPYYDGKWKLLVERVRGCESVSEAVNLLRDQLYYHPIDDTKFWDQMNKIVEQRDPKLAKDVFTDLVGFVFLVGLAYIVAMKFTGPAVSNDVRAKSLRSLMQDWDAKAVDMSDVRPWELAPEIEAVVDEALSMGAKADRIDWLVQLLRDDDPKRHELAAACSLKWLPAQIGTETLRQIEKAENEGHSEPCMPRLTDRFLAAIAQRDNHHAKLAVPETEPQQIVIDDDFTPG